jgi:hypothetical protein
MCTDMDRDSGFGIREAPAAAATNQRLGRGPQRGSRGPQRSTCAGVANRAGVPAERLPARGGGVPARCKK